jgi:Protein of unknown function (DUF2892)
LPLHLTYRDATTRTLAMKKNEAGWDRGLRIALGLGLLALTVAGPKTWIGLVGVVPLATGLVGFCPLYKLFGLRTCPLAK